MTLATTALAASSGCLDILPLKETVSITTTNKSDEQFRVRLFVRANDDDLVFIDEVSFNGRYTRTKELSLARGDYTLRALTGADEGPPFEDTDEWTVSNADCSQRATVTVSGTEGDYDIDVTAGRCDTT